MIIKSTYQEKYNLEIFISIKRIKSITSWDFILLKWKRKIIEIIFLKKILINILNLKGIYLTLLYLHKFHYIVKIFFILKKYVKNVFKKEFKIFIFMNRNIFFLCNLNFFINLDINTFLNIYILLSLRNTFIKKDLLVRNKKFIIEYKSFTLFKH